MMNATLNNTDFYPETCGLEYMKLNISTYNIGTNNIGTNNIGTYNIDTNNIGTNNIGIDNIIDILTVFIVFSSSLLCSTLFVSKYVYSSMSNQFIFYYNNNKEKYDYDPYFFEYLDELYELECCELTDEFLNSLQNKYLKQQTPKGEIILKYNNLNSSFDYYCKKSNLIDFCYLDVVSRIYVVKNNCKKIYFDNFDNYEMIKDFNCREEETLSENARNENARNENASKNIEPNNIFYNGKANKANKSNETIEYISNKYKYKGTIEEFYSYCEEKKYKIVYNNLEDTSIYTYTTFIIEEEIAEDSNNDICIEDSGTSSISFREFKKVLDK